MNQRATGQSSFCDLAVAALGGPKTAALLEKLGAAVPWKKLVAPVLALPEYAKYAQDPSRPGERPIDPLVMLRATMLVARSRVAPLAALAHCSTRAPMGR